MYSQEIMMSSQNTKFSKKKLSENIGMKVYLCFPNRFLALSFLTAKKNNMKAFEKTVCKAVNYNSNLE